MEGRCGGGCGGGEDLSWTGRRKRQRRRMRQRNS